METSPYYLPGAKGEVCGLLGADVDDLLWCGNAQMDVVIQNVKIKYQFGIIQEAKFKFCGRIIAQTEEGIKITSPIVMDRVKPIYY